MKDILYKAYQVAQGDDGIFRGEIKELQTSNLPEEDLLIKVVYSSLNYKDALSARGNKGVTKHYPHTPGIDAAGIVVEDLSGQFKTGEEVIVTGWDLGMNTPGGFGEYIKVPSSWAAKHPSGLSMKESMLYGTAGLTAGLSVYALSQLVKPQSGEILVTGSTGGVGSFSVGLLSKSGYKVTGVTGKPEGKKLLERLGASYTISREEALSPSRSPLLREQWSGVVDTVGGDILGTAIRSTVQRGVITCCGNAASNDLPLTVLPFILRGITLTGIDSQKAPSELRNKIWNLLATDWKINYPKELWSEITLDQLDDKIELMLKGKGKGRFIIKHNH
ncbi:MAG: YhdH/YhfP family quinone oxidoreductase [Spirochaetales bacterium]|nr:YhdH/YhfP family quinone oxidoreductase [Spirochaetales bacterium]